MFKKQQFINKDVLLICFSAFFADLGYQGVTALFPLFLIIELHQPVYIYGIITALSFGAGSFFAYFGGKLGDKIDKKTIAIIGNIFIPLMSLSGLTHMIWLSGLLFILGWWARYFRTPARRALLVTVSKPEYRSNIFGFLHALDIGGGLASTLLALIFVLALHLPIRFIILLSAIPLFVSTALLFFIKRNKTYSDETQPLHVTTATGNHRNNVLFTALLFSAVLYGFSFYNLGFPILTAALAHQYNYSWGILTYAVYLGISAISGYALGSTRLKPVRALWTLGYLPSALSSLLIGLSVLFHFPSLVFYLFIAGLGLGMGAVETYEPTAISLFVHPKTLSSGMGWLSVSRSAGQFLSNLIMGILFSFSQFYSYLYAFIAALLATIILMTVDLTHPEQIAKKK